MKGAVSHKSLLEACTLHGYRATTKKSEEEDNEECARIATSIEAHVDELTTEIIQAAILSADNGERTVLTKDDLLMVKRQIKMI